MRREIIPSVAVILLIVLLGGLAFHTKALANGRIKPVETKVEKPKPTPPVEKPPVERIDRVSLERLVQQLLDARANYGEGLHRLRNYYKDTGQKNRQAWADRELSEYRRIIKYKYFNNLRPRLRIVDPEKVSESDMVEDLVTDRQVYRRTLDKLLGLFHQARDVRRWSRTKRELKGLISVNKYLYLRKAATPGHNLKPQNRIKAAEDLFAEGTRLKTRAGTTGLYRYRIQTAMETFRKLINDYPTSDRIDDAAFAIGELCYDNLKDYERAVRWYECVLAWDPGTQLPANYRIAKIYDKRLNNKLTALHYYQQAQQTAAHDTPERKDIDRRIRVLSGR